MQLWMQCGSRIFVMCCREQNQRCHKIGGDLPEWCLCTFRIGAFQLESVTYIPVRSCSERKWRCWMMVGLGGTSHSIVHLALFICCAFRLSKVSRVHRPTEIWSIKGSARLHRRGDSRSVDPSRAIIYSRQGREGVCREFIEVRRILSLGDHPVCSIT